MRSNSINLGRLNTPEEIEKAMPIIVRLLDNVINLNKYPTGKSRNTAFESRAIGIGTMGEHHMIAKKEIEYNSKKHRDMIDEVYEAIYYHGLKASSDLAREKGSYPKFDESEYAKGKLSIDFYVTEIEEESPNKYDYYYLRELIQKQGLRNGWLFAIAPTSTIGILAGTTSSCEPIYKIRWDEENLSGLIRCVAPDLNSSNYEIYRKNTAFEANQKELVETAAIS